MTEYRNYFTFSKHIENLLFKDLSVSTEGALFGLCIGVAIFTFLYEAVKSLRHYLVILILNSRDDHHTSLSGSEINRARKSAFPCFHLSRKTRRRLQFHCLQTLLHMLQLTLGYMVMLIVMSYNAWLIITVILTTAFCYFFHESLLSQKPPIVPIEAPATNL